MRFYVISLLVLLPALMLLSLLQPFVVGFVEKPIGPEAAVAQPVVGNAMRGEALFLSKCAGCHLPEARFGPPLNTADFQARYAEDADLAFAIRSGREPMPAFTRERLSDQKLADLIAYLRSLSPEK